MSRPVQKADRQDKQRNRPVLSYGRTRTEVQSDGYGEGCRREGDSEVMAGHVPSGHNRQWMRFGRSAGKGIL